MEHNKSTEYTQMTCTEAYIISVHKKIDKLVNICEYISIQTNRNPIRYYTKQFNRIQNYVYDSTYKFDSLPNPYMYKNYFGSMHIKRPKLEPHTYPKFQ